jgi:hypothetical protein
MAEFSSRWIPFACHAPLRRSKCALSALGLELKYGQELAIILEIYSIKADEEWSVEESQAALVSIIERADGTIFAVYLKLVSVTKERSSYHRFPMAPWSKYETKVVAGTVLCRAEFIEMEQEWSFV